MIGYFLNPSKKTKKDNEASHAGEKTAEVLGGGFSTTFSFCHLHAADNKVVSGPRVKEASYVEDVLVQVYLCA